MSELSTYGFSFSLHFTAVAEAHCSTYVVVGVSLLALVVGNTHLKLLLNGVGRTWVASSAEIAVALWVGMIVVVQCVLVYSSFSPTLLSHSNVIAEVAYFVSACIVVGGFGKLLYCYVHISLFILTHNYHIKDRCAAVSHVHSVCHCQQLALLTVTVASVAVASATVADSDGVSCLRDSCVSDCCLSNSC